MSDEIRLPEGGIRIEQIKASLTKWSQAYLYEAAAKHVAGVTLMGISADEVWSQISTGNIVSTESAIGTAAIIGGAIILRSGINAMENSNLLKRYTNDSSFLDQVKEAITTSPDLTKIKQVSAETARSYKESPTQSTVNKGPN